MNFFHYKEIFFHIIYKLVNHIVKILFRMRLFLLFISKENINIENQKYFNISSKADMLDEFF